MRITEINESTTSGSIASVASPIGKTQKRAGTLFKGKKTSKPFYEDEIVEQDLILVPGQVTKKDKSFIPHDKDRTDHEVEMARSDLFQAAKNAKEVYKMIEHVSEDDGLEGWVQEKIIKANDYLNTVREYLEHKMIMKEGGGVIAGGMSNFEEGVTEEQNVELSVDQLAAVSDEALDKAYGYGRSSPGNTFGWQANLKSAEYAKKAIMAGITDIEKISDMIHKGWNVTAKAFVKNPDQFSDTEKLKASGKLEAKLAQREKLMNIEYNQLPEEEKEKDRVVARALLQALTGKQDVAEDLDEAKYRGREVPLGKKMPGDVKKSKVYVRKPNGNVVKVEFGDKNMRIKKNNPKRRKSFRARHNCKNPGPRWKARYWSCRAW